MVAAGALVDQERGRRRAPGAHDELVGHLVVGGDALGIGVLRLGQLGERQPGYPPKTWTIEAVLSWLKTSGRRGSGTGSV